MVPLFYVIQIATASNIHIRNEITLDFQELIYTQQAPNEPYAYRVIPFKHTGLVETT